VKKLVLIAAAPHEDAVACPSHRISARYRDIESRESR
jgi:hypothetical protein